MTTTNKWVISGFVFFAVLTLGFNALSEASTGSITDTFVDESLIASKTNLDVNISQGQVELDDTTGVVYESYTTPSGVGVGPYLSHYYGVTFTPQAAHTVKSVNLKLYRYNSPSQPLYVDLYSTSGGKPIGSSLAQGSITAGEVPSGGWYEISLGAGYALNASTQYALVLSEPSAGDHDYIGWYLGNASPGYPGGAYIYSHDAGSYWYIHGTLEGMFEELGDGYYSSGNLVSTNLLSGLDVSSIDSFDYDASVIPSGSNMRVQFSQDNINWYDSSGVSGAWNMLSEGENSIDLSALGWSGGSFYYNTEFNSDAGWVTSTLDEISLNYSSGVIPEPTSILLLGLGVTGLALFRKRKV